MKLIPILLLLVTSLQAQSNTLKLTAPPLFFVSGLFGGAGEAYLSRDGNWDTRSKRSHLMRDLSIYTTAGGGVLLGASFTLDLKARPRRVNFWHWLGTTAACSVSYYVGTRIAYETLTRK